MTASTRGCLCLVAAQNVLLHSIEQLAPPTLVINPHMHRHKCAHPKSPSTGRPHAGGMPGTPQKGYRSPPSTTAVNLDSCTCPSKKPGRWFGTTLPWPPVYTPASLAKAWTQGVAPVFPPPPFPTHLSSKHLVRHPPQGHRARPTH